jgi:hypothetical protein
MGREKDKAGKSALQNNRPKVRLLAGKVQLPGKVLDLTELDDAKLEKLADDKAFAFVVRS